MNRADNINDPEVVVNGNQAINEPPRPDPPPPQRWWMVVMALVILVLSVAMAAKDPNQSVAAHLVYLGIGTALLPFRAAMFMMDSCLEINMCSGLLQNQKLDKLLRDHLQNVLRTADRISPSDAVIVEALAPILVERLGSEVESRHINATKLLWSLSTNADNRNVLVSAGAISALEKSVRDSSTGSKVLAARALTNLLANSTVETDFEARWVIPPLVHRLVQGPESVKKAVAEALTVLAVDDKNELTIVAHGAVPPLVQMLTNGTDRAKEAAVGALCNLAADPQHKKIIAEAGAVLPLVNLLKHGRKSAKVKVATVLGNLAADNAENQRSIQIAGAIPLLVGMLEGTGAAKKSAAGALKNLAVDADNRKTIVDAGAIKPLLDVPKNGAEDLQAQVAGVLWNLAVDAEYKKPIAVAGALPLLIHLLKEGPAIAQEQAVGALWNLAVNAENKDVIAQAGVFPLLEPYLFSDKENPMFQCPSGWVKHGRKCYLFTKNKLRYADCMAACANYQAGATLLCIENLDQNNFVLSNLDEHKSEKFAAYMIGFSRSHSSEHNRDSFHWFSGCSSAFTHWFDGEPNIYGGTEYYGEVRYAVNGRWYDNGDNELPYCACELVAARTLFGSHSPSTSTKTL